MQNKDSTSRMLLYPANFQWAPEHADEVSEALEEIGLITLDEHGGITTGANFHQLVTFLGCSPSTDTMDACAVDYEINHNGANIIVGKNTTAPRCPKCRWAQQDWREHLNSWRSMHGETPWQCPVCHHTTTVRQMNWRRHAVIARFAISIWGIFPAEAVPAEQLLARLAQLSACPWRYAYLQSTEPASI